MSIFVNDSESSTKLFFGVDDHSSNNSTQRPPLHYQDSNFTQYEKIVIYSIIFLIASVGNTTSFVALLFMNKKQKLKLTKTRIRLILLNLCVGDLMVSYIILPLEIIWAITDSWLAGDFVCKLMMFLRTFGLYLSSFMIITITIDRYYAVLKPLKFDFAFRLSRLLIFAAWIMSFVSSIPQVFVFEVLSHPLDPSFKQCVTFEKLNTIKLKLAYNLYNFMGFYGLPMIIIIFCYGRILYKIALKSSSAAAAAVANNNNNNNNSNSTNNNGDIIIERRCSQMVSSIKSTINAGNSREDSFLAPSSSNKKMPLRRINNGSTLRCTTMRNNYEKAKHKTLKLSLLIVVAFLFSWTPYYFCVLWATIDPISFGNNVSRRVMNYLFTFSVSNTCFNPIIYSLFANNIYEYLPCRPRRRH